MPLVGRQVLGHRSRRIHFDTLKGSVDVRVDKSPKENTTEGFGALKVLIIEGCQSTGKALAEALGTNEDLRVLGTAGDPFEARTLIARERPDVVLMDIVLPKMSGFKFLEKLHHHLPLPVVVFTAREKDTPNLRGELRQLGVSDLIHKKEVGADLEGLLPSIVAALKKASETFPIVQSPATTIDKKRNVNQGEDHVAD